MCRVRVWAVGLPASSAINAANAGGGGIINLAAGCTYVLTQVDNTVNVGSGPSPNGLPAVTSAITLNGFFATIERSSAAPPFRILFVSATGRLILNNLTITGGLASDNLGGGVANQGDLTLNASRVTGNAAGEVGGGIFNDPGPNTSPGVPTLNNPGPNGGPAVLTLNNSRVDHNTTTFGSNDFGGGIYTTGTTTLNPAKWMPTMRPLEVASSTSAAPDPPVIAPAASPSIPVASTTTPQPSARGCKPRGRKWSASMRAKSPTTRPPLPEVASSPTAPR
jgi:hypothetical protein